MRAHRLSLAALVCCLSTPLVMHAQTPAPGGIQRGDGSGTTEIVIAPAATLVVESAEEAPVAVEVFEAVGVRPAPIEPETKPVGLSLDPTRTVETMTNAVLNAKGDWDPTLGRLTTGDLLIDRMIIESGARHGVDPKLVYAVMHQESTFKKNAISPKGASGYMQLMPGTARRFGVTNIFDPKQNIDAGTKYLRFLLDLFNNNVELALAGYNAGEYRVIRDGYRVPQIRETQNYVKKITSRYYGRTGTGGKRHFAVTFGQSRLTEEERGLVVQDAYQTTDDRGTETLSNNY